MDAHLGAVGVNYLMRNRMGVKPDKKRMTYS